MRRGPVFCSISVGPPCLRVDDGVRPAGVLRLSALRRVRVLLSRVGGTPAALPCGIQWVGVGIPRITGVPWLVGIKGQTKEMIARDIELLKKHFRLGTVNVYTDNTTDVKRDEALVQWFIKEYAWLKDDPSIEVLYENTDFGVGD